MKLCKVLFLNCLIILLFLSYLHSIPYKVQKGDNLSAIAAKFNVTVQDIQKANQLNGTNIRAGETLQIPGENDTPTTTQQTVPGAKVAMQKTETLEKTPKVTLADVVAAKQQNTPNQDTEINDTTSQLSLPDTSTVSIPSPAVSYSRPANGIPGTMSNLGFILSIALLILCTLIIVCIIMKKLFMPFLQDMKIDILHRIPANLGESSYKPRNSTSFEFERRFEKMEKLIMSHEKNLSSLLASLLVKAESGQLSIVREKVEPPAESIPVRILQNGKVERHTAFHCYLELVQKEDYYECYICSFVKTPLPQLNKFLSVFYDLEDQELSCYQVVLPAIFKKDAPAENQGETWSLIRRGIAVY